VWCFVIMYLKNVCNVLFACLMYIFVRVYLFYMLFIVKIKVIDIKKKTWVSFPALQQH